MADRSPSFECHSFIRGHHVYCVSWTPVVGEELVLRRQPDNLYYQHAVAVIRDEEIVGHVPRERNMSSTIFYFLAYDGNVGFCRITGPRVNRGIGLGVEVPCVYLFYGGKKYIKKLAQIFDGN